MHSGLPAYFHYELRNYEPTGMIQSSTAQLLQRPLVLTSVASRAFTVAAPTVWNSLSLAVLIALLVLNLNCLHLLMPLRTVQRHHSAQICVLRILLHYIDLMVVVVVVIVG